MSRIVIAGSRGFDDYETAKEYIRKSLKLLNTEDVIILSGGCYGADLFRIALDILVKSCII